MEEWLSLCLSLAPVSPARMPRLTPCCHGNRGWRSMVRTTEWERGEGRKSPPAVPYRQREFPRGSCRREETGVHPQLPVGAKRAAFVPRRRRPALRLFLTPFSSLGSFILPSSPSLPLNSCTPCNLLPPLFSFPPLSSLFLMPPSFLALLLHPLV